MSLGNKSMKPWLPDNHIEMFSTYNEGESVVAEKFITTKEQNLPINDIIVQNFLYT